MAAASSPSSSTNPSATLQFWSFALPIIKCAFCPACLSLFAGLFAGARLGFLGDERFHGWVLVVALVVDFFVLRAAMKHHQARSPLTLCIVGGLVAVLGHATNETIEFIGFGLLMLAALINWVLLRNHHREGGECCQHAKPHRLEVDPAT